MLTSIQIASRYSAILARLKERGYISTDELASELNVSVHTIRRDLNVLESHHQLRRCHGGAGELNKPQAGQGVFRTEQTIAIANAIVAELDVGSCLYVDSQSLGEVLIGLLPEESYYLITQHIDLVVQALKNPFIDIFFLGRDLSPDGDNTSIQMSMAKKLLRQVDHCIIEADYIDGEGNVFDPCSQQVAVKRHFLACSLRQYVVCHYEVPPDHPLAKIGPASHLRRVFFLSQPTEKRINGERV
ncbi:DeoR family transcriptional regulator [Serratia fonticola]|uniref:DeoR family transcriptional regulator n=1 Tax=Serratia fonticola TaxID=47917 RepID=UPI003BB65BBB